MQKVPLEDVLKLVHLYAQKESRKFERAAMKWIRRYLEEREPTFEAFANSVEPV